jgi:hypothetical protein
MRSGSPSDAPRNDNAPAITEVPLRCMPVTHTAVDVIDATRSGARTLARPPPREVAPRLAPFVAVPGEGHQDPQEDADEQNEDDRRRGIPLHVETEQP